MQTRLKSLFSLIKRKRKNAVNLCMTYISYDLQMPSNDLNQFMLMIHFLEQGWKMYAAKKHSSLWVSIYIYNSNGVAFKELKLIWQSKIYILPPIKLVIRDKTKSMPIVSKINLFYVSLSETTYVLLLLYICLARCTLVCQERLCSPHPCRNSLEQGLKC